MVEATGPVAGVDVGPSAAGRSLGVPGAAAGGSPAG